MSWQNDMAVFESDLDKLEQENGSQYSGTISCKEKSGSRLTSDRCRSTLPGSSSTLPPLLLLLRQLAYLVEKSRHFESLQLCNRLHFNNQLVGRLK